MICIFRSSSANYFVLPSNEKQVYSEIISLLEQATQKDGKFGLAYCLIAKAHDILYCDIDRTPEPRTTKLYDRRQDEISLDEIERITI